MAAPVFQQAPPVYVNQQDAQPAVVYGAPPVDAAAHQPNFFSGAPLAAPGAGFPQAFIHASQPMGATLYANPYMQAGMAPTEPVLDFNQIDNNHDGVISREEFNAAFGR